MPMPLIRKMFRLLVAFVVSFLLFTSIPILRGLIGMDRHEKKPLAAQQRRIIAEIVRTPPKKDITPVISLRRVATASAQRMEGASRQNGLSFKIAPDLSIEGAGGASVDMQGQDLEAAVFDETQTDENVIALSIPSIPYPQRAKELGIKGTLQTVITIDRDGKVIKVDIVKSPHASIAEEAKRVMLTWRFKPAKIKGIPVKVRRLQDIEFKLDEE